MPKDKLNISVDLNEKHFFKDLRAKAKSVLEKLKNTDIINKNNGVVARISRDGIDKMMSVDAVNKSLKKNYSKEEHFASVENVDKLFQNATFINSETPRNQSADIVAYHKYNAPFTINGDKKANAKITLKESVVAGNRIYSLELLEIG